MTELKRPKEYFRNSNEYVEYKTQVKGIEVFIHTSNTVLCWFEGKERLLKNSRFFKNSDELMIYLDKIISRIYESNQKKLQEKESQKVQKAENRANIQIGDIFNTHWGYDNTYVDFFQVVGRKSTAKVIIREIDKIKTDKNYFSAWVTPIPNSFIGEEKIVSIDKNGDLVKVDEYGHRGYKTTLTARHYISCGN